MNHTPGPFVHRPRQDGVPGYAITPKAGGRAIALIPANNRPIGEVIANADLFVAAPDLVNGCNALLGLIQLVCGRDDIPAEIKEALESSHRVGEARAAVIKAGVA